MESAEAHFVGFPNETSISITMILPSYPVGDYISIRLYFMIPRLKTKNVVGCPDG